MLNRARFLLSFKFIRRWRTAAVVWLMPVLTVVGCSGLYNERVTEERTDGVLRQKGTVQVPGQQEIDVYYPVAYATPPNLETDDDFFKCVVVEQKPDHFRVKNSQLLPLRVTWKSQGTTAQPVGRPQLSSEPIPVKTGELERETGKPARSTSE